MRVRIMKIDDLIEVERYRLSVLKLFSREKDQRSNCQLERNMEGKKG